MCVAALGLIGAVISGIGSVVGGVMQAQQAQQQAAIYDRQAAAERAQAAYNAGRQQDKSIALMSRQRASYLAAGVAIDSGTPMDIIEDTARETSLDVQAIKYNGEIKAQNFEMQADLFRTKADSAMVGGIFGGIAPVIKGFGGGESAGFTPVYGGGTSFEDA